MHRKFKNSAQAGMTLLELIIACTILLILSSMALPIARFTVIREREKELRLDLREMRGAIDKYKDLADQQKEFRADRLDRLEAARARLLAWPAHGASRGGASWHGGPATGRSNPHVRTSYKCVGGTMRHPSPGIPRNRSWRE